MLGASCEGWLIVGLGNPGAQYERSRHNCGFRAIDSLAQSLGCRIDKARFQGLYGKTQLHGVPVYLLKPMTYMNLSGQSVLQLSAYFRIPPERIIVLSDDISLAPGRLRVRASGSAGGHNGLKSVIEQLGSDAFPRVKIGVGEKPNPEYDLAAWVLGSFPPAQEKGVAAALDAAGQAALCVIEHGVPEAMNRFNGFQGIS